jgi:hypothetical protein
MAKTIEQIQQMITDKADAREVINEIADYLEANSGSGGSGALIKQSPNGTLWLIGVNNLGVLETTITDSGTPIEHLYRWSVDGTKWEITVNNSGALITTAV